MARASVAAVTMTIPLLQVHVAQGARTGDFGGWEMPLEYAGTVAEHMAVRTGVGCFDVSHMGTARITGAGARSAVNAVLANDLDRIGPGRAQYTLLCDERGGVIDDLIAYVVSEDEVLIVPNASNSDAVLSVLRSSLPSGMEVQDLRGERVMLAVQGPRSAEVLDALGLPSSMEYMAFRAVDDHAWSTPGAALGQVIVCRTGYTGERGFELLVPVASGRRAWQALMDAGVEPCGLGARDTLRLEMGYPLHGHELSRDITAVQARLGWAVGWDKPAFHGRDALVAERAAGPARVLRGLRASSRGIPRADMTVLKGGAPVGVTTSGTFSPVLQAGIALALLDPQVAEGDEVEVDVRGRMLPCIVSRPPFVEASAR